MNQVKSQKFKKFIVSTKALLFWTKMNWLFYSIA